MYQWKDNQGVWHTVDDSTNHDNPTADQAPPWLGNAGQGYWDPKQAGTPGYAGSNFNDVLPGSDATRLDRAGIDRRLQGNLEDPNAGQYGGAPGVAGAEEGRYADLAAAARGTKGAQMDNTQFNADLGLDDNSRGKQQYGLQQYQDMIQNGSAVAQRQMQQGLARGADQQASMRNSARGGGGSLVSAQQSAANAYGDQSANVAGQWNAIKAQGQMGAVQGYSQLATSQRAADLQREGLSADQAYAQAKLEETQRGINSQSAMGYENMRQNTFQNQQKGMEYNESENQNAYEGGTGLGEQQSEQAQQERNNYITAVTTTGGQLIGSAANNTTSDKRAKKDIKPGAAKTEAALSDAQIDAYTQRARDKQNAPYLQQLVQAQHMDNASPSIQGVPAARYYGDPNAPPTPMARPPITRADMQAAAMQRDASMQAALAQAAAAPPPAPPAPPAAPPPQAPPQAPPDPRLMNALRATGADVAHYLTGGVVGAAAPYVTSDKKTKKDIKPAREKSTYIGEVDDPEFLNGKGRENYQGDIDTRDLGDVDAREPVFFQRDPRYAGEIDARQPTSFQRDQSPEDARMEALDASLDRQGYTIYDFGPRPAERGPYLGEIEKIAPRRPALKSRYLGEADSPDFVPMPTPMDMGAFQGARSPELADYLARSNPGVEQAMDHLKPYSYSYKDPSNGAGQRVGVMAQDLEKSPVGLSTVIETPRGKAIDTNRGLSLSLAGLADLHERVKALEGRRATRGEE